MPFTSLKAALDLSNERVVKPIMLSCRLKIVSYSYVIQLPEPLYKIQFNLDIMDLGERSK